jgi:hypothetical protein
LLSLSQLLFLFLESRFGAVTRPFNVGIGVQCRYSFSSESARRTDFPASCAIGELVKGNPNGALGNLAHPGGDRHTHRNPKPRS